jgi:hypothetical protein
MAAVRLLKFLPVLAVLTLVFGAVTIIHMFRARAMRILAARWGFQYIGPAAPKWRNPSHPEISPPLPVWFSLACHPSGKRIRQVWNVIAGQHNGVSVLTFDSVIGRIKGGAPCTLIACQTEQNPFGVVASPDRAMRSDGWTVLHGVWFLQFSWTMSIKRLDNYLNKLRVGSARGPSSWYIPITPTTALAGIATFPPRRS